MTQPGTSDDPARPLNFAPEDFEVLDLALQIAPELRVAAIGVKLARQAGVEYPIESLAGLVELIPSGLEAGRHVVVPESLQLFFPDEFFPIKTEAELMFKAYAALVRCREETRRALTISPDVYTHVRAQVKSGSMEASG